MRIPKRYGQSRSDLCPFCKKLATTINKQKIPVCITHKDRELNDLKCQCGDWLDLKVGKYGPYFYCFKCGNIPFARAMELNDPNANVGYKIQKPKKSSSSVSKPNPNYQQKSYTSSSSNKKKYSQHERKETVITSDKLDAYFS